MSDSQPTPVPPPRRPDDPQPATISNPGSGQVYDILADKIGGVPNIRKKDNLYQAAAIAVFVLLGMGVGGMVEGWPQGVLVGALGGLIAGVLISGVVLMIVGLRRK